MADERPRPGGTVGEIGSAEPLRPLPSMPYPARIAVDRKASRSALVCFEANRYSIPPTHAGRTVTVVAHVGDPALRIVSAAGEIVAEHRPAAAGAGLIVRSREHAAQLERAVLEAFTTRPAWRRKSNQPAGEAALAELAKLRGLDPHPASVISLERYAQLARVAG
jgi:hypothetical protein